MTPAIFVSFLFSLAWVELRYSMLRSHAHDTKKGHGRAGTAHAGAASHSGNASGCDHRVPGWLHHVVYRRQPYHYVLVSGSAKDSGHDDGTYYHSMQRKLLKMESDEAFRIRTTVLWVMGAAAAGTVWAMGLAARWVAGLVWR